MVKFSAKKSTLGLVIGLLANTTVMADIVFDPSNFGKNTITAQQTVRQTAHQAAILAEEIKQYQMILQDLKQLDPSVIANGTQRGMIPDREYKNITDVYEASKGVYATTKAINSNMDNFNSTYNKINQVMSDLESTSIKSHVPTYKIIQYDYLRSQQGIKQDQNSYERLQYLNGQLEQHRVRADELAKELPKQNGTVQLLQTLGSQNTLIQDQLSQLIQVTTTNAAKLLENSMVDNQKKQLDSIEKKHANDSELRAADYLGAFRKK